MNHSVYAINSFLVMLGVFAGIGILSLIATVILIRCALNSQPLNAMSAPGFLRGSMLPRVVVATLSMATGSFVLALAAISGYLFMHPAISIALGCVLWYLTTAANLYVLFGSWRPSSNAASAYTRRFATTATGSSSIAVTFRRAVTVCLLRARTFNALCFAGYVVCYALVFSMYGMCYCTNPFQLTTWSSRRSQPKYCSDNVMCHQYAMLGRNYSRMRIVSHLVTSVGPPLATSATLCKYDEIAEAPDCSGTMPRSLQGSVVPHVDTLGEDARYLSHVLLTDLASDTAYYVNVSFTLADGGTTSGIITFRTVPQDRRKFSFLSGGDMQSNNGGQWLLFIALAARSDPSFVVFGGDLSYSNNMRSCYLRFDYFCSAISTLRNSRGRQVPLMIVPGNHESGGYLPETDWSQYFFYLPYFPQYDDDIPASPYQTHHSHEIGQLLILGLDSGLMESVGSQVGYVTSQLQSAAAKRQTAVAVYHNPMFPSIRNYGDSNSAAVRDALLPTFLQYNVTLGLEFHDHAYKRTFFVNRADALPVASNTAGIVFIGDGGLGTMRDTTSDGDHAYLAVFFPVPNVQVITVNVNGSIAVATYDSSSNLLDAVLIPSRV